MTTPIVKSLIDEQVESLSAAFNLPRETRVCDLPHPIKGTWPPPSDLDAFMRRDFGHELRAGW